MHFSFLILLFIFYECIITRNSRESIAFLCIICRWEVEQNQKDINSLSKNNLFKILLFDLAKDQGSKGNRAAFIQ